jgi:hypothetical protein
MFQLHTHSYTTLHLEESAKGCLLIPRLLFHAPVEGSASIKYRIRFPELRVSFREYEGRRIAATGLKLFDVTEIRQGRSTILLGLALASDISEIPSTSSKLR